MKEERVPSDVIKAIFHFLGEESHFRFPANIPRIHSAFYELSQERDLSTLFEDFVFDTSKIFPYCETVSYALDRLQKSSLLACINPSLNEFEISNALSRWNIEKTELFNENEKDLLKKAAKKFEDLIEEHIKITVEVSPVLERPLLSWKE